MPKYWALHVKPFLALILFNPSNKKKWQTNQRDIQDNGSGVEKLQARTAFAVPMWYKDIHVHLFFLLFKL